MGRRALRVATLVAVLAAAIAAASAQRPPSTEAGVSVNNINWRDCSGESLFRFDCGTVRVPLRHGRVGQTIDIAVIRHRALDAERRIGVLLMNPGGPGGSGVQLAQQAPFFLPPAVVERFDIIGFDPRGVGRSSAVDCVDGFGDLGIPDPTPDSQAERKHFYEALREFAEACQRRGLPLIQYVDTESAARDMEYLRVALGEETISYLGFSYGTSLGATYAGLFPERVRAFVLDGAIDPALDAEGLTIGSAMATERAFRAFLGDCLARPDCGFRAGDGTVDGLLAAFDELLARTEEAPIPSVFMPGPPVGPGELLAVTRGVMYEPLLWPLFAGALGIAYEENDGWLIANFPFSGGPPDEFDNIAEAFPAINCADYDFPRSEAENDELLDRAMAAAPRFGAAWLALS
ncbi:MAG TPA: alpha/beta fold hydrolase, partial [Dehalococcoidia bacterium]|nr:alpha/beta fold hydrolase [Dehalococcoidia bacterium]